MASLVMVPHSYLNCLLGHWTQTNVVSIAGATQSRGKPATTSALPSDGTTAKAEDQQIVAPLSTEELRAKAQRHAPSGLLVWPCILLLRSRTKCMTAEKS